MNCPKCNSQNTTVTNSYKTDGGTVQRRICNDCMCVFTTQVLILNVDPPRGEGAYSLAKKVKRGSETQE